MGQSRNSPKLFFFVSGQCDTDLQKSLAVSFLRSNICLKILHVHHYSGLLANVLLPGVSEFFVTPKTQSRFSIPYSTGPKHICQRSHVLTLLYCTVYFNTIYVCSYIGFNARVTCVRTKKGIGKSQIKGNL